MVNTESVHSFVTWYNTEHRHSSLKFVTPMQRHSGEDESILNHRKKVYEMAKKQQPKRWSGNTRNWDRLNHVLLNPENEICAKNEPCLNAA